MLLAERVYEGNILELSIDDSETLTLTLVTEYGDRIAQTRSGREAMDMFKHTALYEDRFTLHAPDWNDKDWRYDERIGAHIRAAA